MSSSPKRKIAVHEESNDESVKKLRIDDASEDNDDMIVDPPQIPSTAPDSQIDHAAAIAYWSSTSADNNGMLGGYAQHSRVDLQGSRNFLAKLLRRSKHLSSQAKLTRVVDCGAGIGRITKGLLSGVADIVDIVEPVRAFTDQIKDNPSVGTVYNVGIEQWVPEHQYDVIWTQWCLSQATDVQAVKYLQRLPPALGPGGWVVVKENVSKHEDVFDETDSSVTRTDAKYRQLFDDAGLKVVAWELQNGWPKDLYAVHSYALQPR